MTALKLPPLKIGDLVIDPPIIQGGMGVRVSRAGLASAVANAGGVGIIAAVGLGAFEDKPAHLQQPVNLEALRQEIRKARSMTKGVIGVNIMVALSGYEEMVDVSIEEGVDVIISGAGLPMDLPGHLNGKDVKLIPIVSSARALALICKKWSRNYSKLPDAVVVEGPRAGGHLGFKHEQMAKGAAPSLETILAEVVELANTFSPPIPVIAAGGVFDGADIVRMLKLGASGVQMATRFVTTDECDVHPLFKEAYLKARPEDLVIIKSPVGLPGRVIKNEFVERIQRGETVPFKCRYLCLRSCDPSTAPFCIARALANAAEGNLDEGFVFSGSNSHRCTKIVPVAELMEALKAEAAAELAVHPFEEDEGGAKAAAMG